MSNIKIKISLFINFFVIGILLNSVGIVILQVIQHYAVTKEAASILEAFKDLSIAVFSFLVASYIPKFGYKRSMLAALVLVTATTLGMRFMDSFLMSKIMFASIGISFALIKVSAYSTVGIITENSDDHASLMSILEGIFMVGVLSGYWIFGFFIESEANQSLFSWLDTYWVLAALCVIAFIMLFITKLDESSVVKENFNTLHEFLDMIALVRFPLVIIFVLSAFFYVLIEQSIQTWLPTFNKEILHLPSSISVQIVSILAGAIALGRITGGYFIKKFHWMPVLTFTIGSAMLLVILVIPITVGIEPGSVTSWSDTPIAAYLLPLIGMFLGPIYPALNSSILSALPKNKQSAMTGLIVIFSALGGTTGSVITGTIFGRFDGQTAFYFTLVPMALLLTALFFYNKVRQTFEFKEI
ncbi:MAG: MFS transporter [Melioribacteraceae bacterium]|nr:MFS transporter [Melioribacteraceae bacterium]MCF8353299.1 MFS transporter [Melioribacteraceae bacterium]MCF8395414.1 MFS transporter [Melioribacteraceae bacterium]MCF8418826.1 MFS transporter [Melioribacteraceae bacterium]